MASTSVVFDIIGRDRASQTFNNVAGAADKSSGRMAKFGQVAKTVGKVGGLAIAAGAVVAAKGLFDMTKAAIEDEAAQKRLATSLKNAAGATKEQISSVEDWISAQGKALGVTDDDLRPAMARLVEATGDVGKAQKLASIAMDVSAGTGKSLKSVSEALARAQNGNVGALSRYGIATKNAKGETLTFEQITKRMSQTFKGQAEKNANTLSGKMQRLKVVLSEAGEEIGAKLIPIVTKLADWFLNKGVPALEAFGRYLGEKIPPVVEKVRAAFDKAREFLSKFTGDGSGKLSKFWSDVKGIFKDGVSIVQDLWRLFGANIVEFLVSTFKNVKSVISGAFDIIKGIFKTVSALLKGDWRKAWEGIKDILRGAVKIVRGVVGQLFDNLKFAFKNAGVILRGIWSKAWDLIKQLAGKAKDWLVDKIKSIPGAIKSLAGRYQEAGRWILGKFVEIVKAKAAEGGQFIVEKIREIPGRIKDLVGRFREAGGALVGAIANGIKNAAGFATDFASQIWQAVKSAINSGIDQLNNLLEFSFSVKGVGIHVDAPDIGHLARGTSNWRGGLAVVGEEGPELVNLPRGSRVTPHRQSMGMMRGLGGGGDVHVHFHAPVAGDPRAFAREVRKQLLQHKRELGAELGLA